MKRSTKIISHLSVASLMAMAAFAQDPSMPAANGVGMNARYSTLKEALKYSDLKGLTVQNQENEKLGKVQDFAVDLKSGRIVEVIVSTGGFMGVDSTLTAVPPRALHHNMELKVLQINVDKEKFNAAPKITAATWDADMESNRVVELYGYYNVQPYFAPGYDEANTNLDGTLVGTLPRNMDGTVNPNGARAVDTAHNLALVGTNADGSLRTNQMDTMQGNYAYNFGNSHIEKASRIVGMTITNLQGETIGKVENLALDLSSGHVVAVIVSTGGIMGVGGDYSAVPPSAFSFNDATNALQLDVSKETLTNSPHFTSSQWPDLSQPSYTTGVYRSYHVQPYFSADADNTARNVRDRNNQTLTPLDQGNNQADISTTAQIRKDVMADSSLSVNAHNCKIITMNGHVTLRGPVNSEDEKSRIADIANRIAQSGNVDNQLEVISKNNN